MPFFDHYPYTNFHNVNLDWILERVKEWGQMVEDNNTRFENLQQANEDFKEYVTNYLQNLDIQAEIDDKLDRMFESGELTEYFQPYVSDTVTTWLDQNITEPEGVVIDTSLTVSGACADAKVTGDKINQLKLRLLSVDRMTDNADFNDYLTPWTYCLYANDSYSNAPLNGYQGILEIINEHFTESSNILRVFQRVTYFVTDSQLLQFGRIYSYLTNTWTNWIVEKGVFDFKNTFIVENKNFFYLKAIQINNGVINLVDAQSRICSDRPFILKYNMVLRALDNYEISLMLVNDPPNTDDDILILNSGWQKEVKIKRYTPFYLQFRKSDNSAFNNRLDFVDHIESDITSEDINYTFDLCVFAGQSNMAGRGITNQSHPESVPELTYNAGYEYNAISNPYYLRPITEPFGRNENKEGGINDGVLKTGSMVTAFANAYYKNSKTTIIGVSASVGGSSIYDWQPNSNYLNDAIQRLNDAKNFINSTYFELRHIYLVWCQGEHESGTETTDDDNQYKQLFLNMFNVFKNNGVEKCILCRIGEINNSDQSDIVIAKQTELAQDNNDVIMGTTVLASFRDKGYMQDNLHFYQDGYNLMGTYCGTNAGIYATTGKEPTMYDYKYNNLYYSHKN